MNKTAFGASMSGHRVVQILESIEPYKRKKLQRLACRIFNEFCLGMNELYGMEDRKTFHRMWLLWKEDFVRVINGTEHFPEILRTHLANALTAFARDTIRLYIIENGKESPKVKARMEALLDAHRQRYLDQVEKEENGSDLGQ